MRYFLVPLCWVACTTVDKENDSGPASPTEWTDTGASDSGAPPDDTGEVSEDSGESDSGESDSGGTDSGEDSGTDPEDTGEPADPCAGIEICEDFENHTPGQLPETSTWNIVTPNCSGAGQIIVSDDQARSGSTSVKTIGVGGYCDHIFMTPVADVSVLGPTVHGRFWMRIENAFGWEHITFLAMQDEIEGKDLRMGGQSQIMMWNRESDDATLPELSPTGISMSHAPVVGEWFCVRFKVDEIAGTIDTWIDDVPIEGLTQDGIATPDVDRQWVQQKPGWAPSLIDFKLGWESYGGVENTLWYDDIALSSSSLSCD